MYRATRFMFRDRGGQSAFALILILGGLIVMIAVSLAFLTTSFVNSAYGFRAAQKAEEVASAGISDGLLQLVRNKDFPSQSYSVAVGSDSATVTITKDSPAANETTISSSATIVFRQRTITIVVSRDATTGQITQVSRQQT